MHHFAVVFGATHTIVINLFQVIELVDLSNNIFTEIPSQSFTVLADRIQTIKLSSCGIRTVQTGEIWLSYFQPLTRLLRCLVEFKRVHSYYHLPGCDADLLTLAKFKCLPSRFVSCRLFLVHGFRLETVACLYNRNIVRNITPPFPLYSSPSPSVFVVDTCQLNSSIFFRCIIMTLPATLLETFKMQQLENLGKR